MQKPTWKFQCLIFINPRKYTQIHTTLWYKLGGGGWNPPLEFLIRCSISNQWKAFVLVNKIRYIIWVVALLEACDVTKNSCHLSRHLVFYKEFRHQVKTASNGDFFMLDTKNNTSTSTMHGFSHQIYLKKLKTCTFNQSGLTPLTSYLVTIETDHHWTWLKMRARDERTAAENIRYLCFILQEKKTQKNLGGGGDVRPRLYFRGLK